MPNVVEARGQKDTKISNMCNSVHGGLMNYVVNPSRMPQVTEGDNQAFFKYISLNYTNPGFSQDTSVATAVREQKKWCSDYSEGVLLLIANLH